MFQLKTDWLFPVGWKVCDKNFRKSNLKDFLIITRMIFYFLKIIWRISVLFGGHCYPCFGLLLTSALGFKERVDPSLAASSLGLSLIETSNKKHKPYPTTFRKDQSSFLTHPPLVCHIRYHLVLQRCN